ncbi:alpha/beta hydrolase [Marinibactrum halimedae]|uniref:Carboxylesterase n=1 Tax=Marinibactrum halimedae TaxID=1444977 RepID=A0AA37T4Z5_9GAMM|nr:dienelactone hydrolase family protein [Marinibactrum halimedae]MCD9457553.1 dienelactone hydrolase family protein [Marinibactrum halimedae]GLS25393.1 carboxylesterase [Marinibactrum halimedae]
MSSKYLECVEINPERPAQAAVIWLHGLGASGHDFVSAVPELSLPVDLAVRFIFPHAPEIPVTINNGYVMPAWYDILEMSIERKVDQDRLRYSAQQVIALIEREIERGVDSKKIVLAGFSQGGAVAYEVALSYDKPLAGLMAMSTYFATAETVKDSGANKALPIEIYHGTQDPVVPEMLGRSALSTLQSMGYNPIYKTYPMEHSLCFPQLSDISAFIQAVID